MTLQEMKKKVLGLIEELNPDSELLTDDPDISTKINDVTNQVMYELARFKKIPKYVEMEVTAGDLIEFADIEKKCGYEIYQIGIVGGVKYVFRGNGTILKFLESGTAEIDCFVYPERITEKTKDKADVSTEYGSIYATRYQSMLQMLDPRYNMTSVYIEGGVDF